jgi:Zn-dependent protease with chaperone function
MIGCMILGTVIAGMAWLALSFLRPVRARLRFRVWFVALTGVAVVPLLQILVHGLGVASGGAPVTRSGLILLPADWATYLFGTWVLCASVALARVVAGVFHMRRVASNSPVLDWRQLDPVSRETVERVARTRRLDIRVSDRIRVPVAIGLFRPAVVIPRSLLRELSAGQLNQVLLHETAHLARYDDWNNLLQKVVQALLFFCPAVWWLDRRLTLDREMACDEAVVAATANARGYAECLALLAEKNAFSRGITLVQAAVSRLRHTSIRVKELLANRPETAVPVWKTGAALLGTGVVSFTLVGVPALVSFQQPVLQSGTARGAKAVLSAEVVHPTAARAQVVPPQVVPAASTTVATVRPLSAERVGRASSRSRSETNGRVLLASQRSARKQRSAPATGTVETVVVVEGRNSSIGREQVWQVWQVRLFYSNPERNTARGTKKI